MPTKNPRLHVVLEKPVFRTLKGRARKDGLSLSLEARELIRRALRSEKTPASRVYTGNHIAKLIGRFPMGKEEPERILAEQVHG